MSEQEETIATPEAPAPPTDWHLNVVGDTFTVALLTITPDGEVSIHPDVARQIAAAVVEATKKGKK